MLTRRSWDELLFPSTFQNGSCGEELGNFPISAHNYHTSTILISKYMLGFVLNSLLNIKRVKMQEAANFTRKRPPILPETYHLSERIICYIINV